LIILLVLGAVSAFYLTRVPEPEYNDVKLGSYLTNHYAVFGGGTQSMFILGGEKASETLAGLGPKAVPYLVNEMTPNPAYELMFRITPRLPTSLQKFTPDKGKHDYRRMLASVLLCKLDTDAITALPHALRAVERMDPVVLYYCVNIIGWHAPGTPYEDRTVKALIGATEAKDANTRRVALHFLQRIKTQHPEIIPVLVRNMYEPGLGVTCMDSLVRFGTNALPALKKAAEDEKKGHIRLAEMTIEKIEQQSAIQRPSQ
jgi:hypothetical protein